MKVDGRPTRTIWPSADGEHIEVIDQTVLPHRFATLPINEPRGRGQRNLDDGRARRAADRRDRRLWPRSRPARGSERRRARARLWRCCCARARRPSIFAGRSMTSGRWSAALAPDARAAAAWRRAGEICDEDVALCRSIGAAGLPLIEDSASSNRSAGQRPDPLQRRLARDRRLGHGDRADLYGARSRRAGACLRRRDAAAQSGRLAHRLRARPAWRAAHAHRRQCGRPSHAARPHRSLHRRRRPRHRAWRRRQQDRHLSQGARCARPMACRSMSPLPHTTIDWTIEDGVARSRSRSATRARSPICPDVSTTARSPASRSPRLARRRSTRPST